LEHTGFTLVRQGQKNHVVVLLFIAAMAQLWAGLPTATCAVQAREKERFHHSGAQKRLRLTPEAYCAGGKSATYYYQM
jgi:hypothetical protein